MKLYSCCKQRYYLYILANAVAYRHTAWPIKQGGGMNEIFTVIRAAVHEWLGHNDYARERARMLAKMGYIALAVDMYGDG